MSELEDPAVSVAEAKDYRDISAMLAAGVERALGAFTVMYGEDAALPLKGIGYFKDGDLPSLPEGGSWWQVKYSSATCSECIVWWCRGGT